VLTPPDGLSEDQLVSALGTHWRLDAEAIAYRAVGFGSHHWEIVDAAGTRWFATADELHNKRMSLRESPDVAFGRLRHALDAALDLHSQGYAFVVAPVPSAGGEPLVRAGAEFGLALYPFVAGESFEWGEFATPGHRHAVLDMVVALHTAPAAARTRALADSYAVPHRDELDAVLALAPGEPPETGPYTRPMTRLFGANKAQVGLLLARYDELAARAVASPARAVLTHGEPHRSNTMLTESGWRLIDWDTALIAAPERDLWMLEPGDGSVLSAYAAATGVKPQAALLELFRLRWDVADLAVDVSRFCRPHRGSAEDRQSWELLCEIVGQLSA
jgi:aminoglycoside phosphotransferase (APT) family kinase protein